MNHSEKLASTTDPVCGMTVEQSNELSTNYKDHTYSFCSEHCLNAFKRDPESYVAQDRANKPSPETHISSQVIYTCPMHPQIRQIGPGNCPICGMALEPAETTAEEEPNLELIDMIRRFKGSLIFTVPLLLIAMSDLLPGMPLMKVFSPSALRWIELALTSPVIFWAAYPLSPPFSRGQLCLIVGIDQAPYLGFVHQTLRSAIPVLFVLALLFIGVLFVLVRILMKDLTRLNRSLQSADFGATHAFPPLPTAHTNEVRVVVEQLQKLHDQAAHAYQEIWLFLGRAAHQLKTPVAGIQATLQVTLRKERTKEELLASLKDLGVAADLLTDVTQKLISSSRISYESMPSPEPIELVDFFTTQTKIFQFRAEQRRIHIQIERSSEVRVLGTRSLLNDVFGNLIENAVLYSHSEGTIRISWTEQENHAVISIRDNGPGFPESVKAFLFKPFIRGDERHVPGSGLGLSIAYKATQLLKGTISLDRSDSSGSLISVTLPSAK